MQFLLCVAYDVDDEHKIMNFPFICHIFTASSRACVFRSFCVSIYDFTVQWWRLIDKGDVTNDSINRKLTKTYIKKKKSYATSSSDI